MCCLCLTKVQLDKMYVLNNPFNSIMFNIKVNCCDTKCSSKNII